MRLRALSRGCYVLGPVQFKLVFRKKRLQWIIDYGKHVYAAFKVCLGRDPTPEELYEALTRLVGYKPSHISTRVIHAIIREVKRTEDLVQRYYFDLMRYFTPEVAAGNRARTR